MYLTDVTIRLEESIDDNDMPQLERLLRAECHIDHAWLQDKRRHLMAVAFDAEEVEPSMIVRSMRNHGWHPKAFGW
jgi:hypothetical protein